MKFLGVGWVSDEGLRDEDGVLGVVTDHAASENEALFERAGPSFLDAAGGHAFGGKANGVACCGTEEGAGDGFLD